VRYLFMAFHYPKPEYRDDLIRWIGRVSAALRAQPGLLTVADFDDPASGRIVAVSIWGRAPRRSAPAGSARSPRSARTSPTTSGRRAPSRSSPSASSRSL